MRNLIWALVLTLLPASTALAGDVALLVGVRDYQNAPRIGGAYNAGTKARQLEQAGFKVIQLRNPTGTELRAAVSNLNDLADGSGRIVVALSGHFAYSNRDSWLLARNADKPDIADVLAPSMSLDVVMEIAARAPGQAVLLLGTTKAVAQVGKGLKSGLNPPAASQGVTIIEGTPERIGNFIGQSLLNPGQSVAQALTDWPDLKAHGFLSKTMPFMAAASDTRKPTSTPSTQAGQVERRLWQIAENAGTLASYQFYLSRFPNGAYAAQARRAISDLGVVAEPSDAEVEEALSLDRESRRKIQRSLTLLGFDTRGVDGIFGRGTRAAISNWQTKNNEDKTGYLTQDQVDFLFFQADRRAAELEEEARKRQAQQERDDRNYWRVTGAEGDEAGYREYIRRFPDGLYSDIATERLEDIEQKQRSVARRQDRLDWEDAEGQNSLQSYQRYLQLNPKGAFAQEAGARIQSLQDNQQNAPRIEAAQRAEKALNMNAGMRRLIEDRLEKLGLSPGPVDGTFDKKTRRAIRRYQEARELPKTGYLTQQTFVRIMADSILR